MHIWWRSWLTTILLTSSAHICWNCRGEWRAFLSRQPQYHRSTWICSLTDRQHWRKQPHQHSRPSLPSYRGSHPQKEPATEAANHQLSWPTWANAAEILPWERENCLISLFAMKIHSCPFCSTNNTLIVLFLDHLGQWDVAFHLYLTRIRSAWGRTVLPDYLPDACRELQPAECARTNVRIVFESVVILLEGFQEIAPQHLSIFHFWLAEALIRSAVTHVYFRYR